MEDKSLNDFVSSIDLNSGLIDAVTNPPQGFVSKFDFAESNLESRLKSIGWFENVGKPFKGDLSMGVTQVNSWGQAMQLCQSLIWENTTLEARNQLTVWLHLNAKVEYRKWNEIVIGHKADTINVLTEEKIIPFQKRHHLDITFVHCVRWDILGALMENSYLKFGHQACFFLELLLIYEAGHFPCGWKGKFPEGDLFVY